MRGQRAEKNGSICASFQEALTNRFSKCKAAESLKSV
jgi:hypothetical protein